MRILHATVALQGNFTFSFTETVLFSSALGIPTFTLLAFSFKLIRWNPTRQGIMLFRRLHDLVHAASKRTTCSHMHGEVPGRLLVVLADLRDLVGVVPREVHEEIHERVDLVFLPQRAKIIAQRILSKASKTVSRR